MKKPKKAADVHVDLGREAKIDAVVATYYRKGKCERCGKHAERERTFRGATLEECNEQANAWANSTLFHRRCEP